MTLLATTLMTVLLICLNVLPGWSQTPNGEVESPYPYIHSLKITGNKSIPSKMLYNEMLTPRPHIFMWKTPHEIKFGRIG